MRAIRSVPLFAALALGGCEFPTVGCDLVAEPSIVVHVKDASTGAWAASGAMLYATAQDGTADTSGVIAGHPEWDAYAMQVFEEKAGTFTVTVSKPGYYSATVSGVHVNQGSCHVQTVRLTARLQPAPGPLI